MKQPTTTVLEKIKELDAQREQIVSEAKKDALTRAHEAAHELNALVFSYYLGEGRATPVRRARAAEDKSARHKPSADKPCTICN